MRYVIAYCAIAASLVVSASSRAGFTAPATTLRADVAEWSIVPSAGVVPAGRVRIEVRNLGTTAHEIVLVRTSSFGARLRLRGTHAVVPSALGTVVVKPGARTSFVVSLKAGSYLLLDNLPWHYWKGTSAAFSVR